MLILCSIASFVIQLQSPSHKLACDPQARFGLCAEALLLLKANTNGLDEDLNHNYVETAKNTA